MLAKKMQLSIQSKDRWLEWNWKQSLSNREPLRQHHRILPKMFFHYSKWLDQCYLKLFETLCNNGSFRSYRCCRIKYKLSKDFDILLVPQHLYQSWHIFHHYYSFPFWNRLNLCQGLVPNLSDNCLPKLLLHIHRWAHLGDRTSFLLCKCRVLLVEHGWGWVS